MSTTVDERVVEMRFDNKHFESNVSTSMSTLDKLKQKLKLDGATKGLEDIDSASKKIDMSSLGSAVGSVGAKFSALQVVAVTALANITNSAVNAGKQLISSLSIDQVTAGWQKFSDKTTSVATLVAQGNAIEDVNDQLDRLNWFTDETSYNFTEMVSNIAKFTATGKGLNESVTAMEGIATWAALSGQNATTASRAMYQLSQAMGAGVMRLEDYKSIQNASMDTEEFRKKCIEAGIALGTLKDNGDGTYTSLVEGAAGTSWSISQFANNLTKEMWLTSDVMMSVFNTYSSAVDGIYNAAEEKGMLASEIIDEIYTVAEEKSISTDEAIQLLGYDFDSFALKAFEAAQKARTFNDAIDSVKDAVSTGWMKTFELIFGDAEKATELWTDLANTLWDVFAAGGEIRNTILEFALNFAKPWQNILDKLNAVDKTFSKVTDTVKTATDKLEYFQDIVNKVWRGDYNNRGDNPDRFDLLTAAGYDSRVVQELVNKGYQYELTIDDVEAAHKKFGLTMEATTEETEKTVDATNEATKAYQKLTDEQLEQAGLTEDEISLYRAMEKEAERLGITVEELADEMSTNDGRTLLIESFKNAGNGLLGILQAIKEAWKEIFGDPTVGEQAVKLYSLIKSLNAFSEKLRLTDAETGELNETGEKLRRTFKGIFAIVDIITTILGGAFKIVVKVIKGVLDSLGISVLDVTASIGDLLVAFRDWLLEDNIFAQAITSLINNLISKIPVVIEKFKEWFGVLSDWFNTFKETPAVQKFIDAITGIGEALKKLFSGEINIAEFAAMLGKNLGSALGSIPSIAFQVGKDFIAGFGEGIANGVGGIIKSILNFCSNFISNFATALGVQSPSWKAAEIASDFFQGFINGAKNAIGAVLGVLKKIGEGIVQVFKSLWDFLTDESGNLEWGKIFAAGSIVALILVLKKFADVISGFAGILDSFSDLIDYAGLVMKNFSKVLKSIAWDIKAEALKKMAIAIALLVASIWVLTTIDDVGKLWNAVGVIAVLAVILFGLSIAMDKLSAASVKWDKGPQIEGIKSGLLQIGIAILLVAAAVKMIGNMDADKAEQGFKGVIGIAIGMIAFLAAMGGISRYSGSVDGVGKMMTKLAVAMLLMVIVCKIAGNLSAEEMAKGLLFIGTLGGFIVGVTVMAKGAQKDIKYVGGMFIKLAIAMMLMVVVCKLAAKLSAEQMTKGTLFAGAFVGFVAAIVAVTKISNEQQIAKIGGLLLSISIAMMLMVGVCKLVGKLSYDDMLKGAVFMGAFVGFVAAIVAVTKIGNEQKIAQVSATIIAMSFGIAILAGICVLLSFLDEKSLAKGVTAVSVLCAMMALMVKGLKGAQEVKGTMMWMTLAIVAMAAAVVALSFIDTKSLIASTASMAVMMGMFALMIKSMSKLEKGKVAIGAIATLTGVLLVMAGLIFLLQNVKPENAIGNALALSVLMLAMAGLLEFLVMKTINPKKALKSALALSMLAIPLLLFAALLAVTQDINPSIKTVATLMILTGAMAGLLEFLVMKTINPKKALKSALALSTLAIPLLAFAAILFVTQNIDTSIKTVATLTLLMGAMAGLLEFLLVIKPNTKKAFKSALALTAMAIPLLAFTVVLAAMSGVDNAISSAIALTILAGACSGMLVVLAYVGKLGLGKALKGVLALTAMTLPLLTFVGVLALMSGVENAMANVKALTILATALTLLLLPLILVGALIYPALMGVVALTAMAVPMLAFVGVLALMNKVENATDNINLLLDMMSTMTDLLIKIALVGPMALIGVTAMTGLAGLMAVIGVVATAIGALMQKFPSIQDFLDTGLPVLEQLATSIGKMIGNFVSGLAGGIAEAMVKIADSLVEFTSTLSVSSLIARTIKPGSFDGVKDLLLVLIEIAGTSVVTSIGDIFSSLFSGQTTMEKFENDAVAFMNAMKNVCKASNGVNIDQASFDAIIAAAQALATLQSSLEPMGGVVQWFMGEKNLGSFGESVADFIRSMKVAFNTLDGMKLDIAAFTSVMLAAQELAKLQSSLEPIGGVVSWFTGRDDLGTFGANVADFIESMKEAFWTLDGMTLDANAFGLVIDATSKLSELSKTLEPIGGVVTWFTGRSDLGTFGKNMIPFFESMKRAFSVLEGTTLDEVALENMIHAVTALAPLSQSIEPIGGVVQWFKGHSDLGTFGEGIVSFAEGMKKLGECGVIDSESIDSMIPAAQKLSEFRNSLEPIGGVVSWFTGDIDFVGFGNGIYAFATGMQALSGCGTINEEVLQNLVTSSEKLSELEANLNGHGGIFSIFGDQDLTTFGTGITSFANGMKSVSEVGPVDPEVFNTVIDAATQLSDLEKGLDGIGGVVSWFVGRSDLATFGKNIEAFIVSIKNAFFIMEGMTYDATMFAIIIDAAGQLSELEKNLKDVGGVVDFFTGQSDLGTFGENLESFISSMKSAFVAMDGLKYDSEAFGNIMDAAYELSTLEKDLKNVGGVVSWFAGRSDLGTFGENIGKFADGMQDLADCQGFNKETVDGIIEAAESLKDLENSLETSVGGVISWFTGRSDLGTFGESIGKFAEGMIKLSECSGFDENVVKSITDAAESLQELAGKLDGSIGGIVTWFKGQDQNLGTFGESIGKFADGFQKLANCEGVNATTLETIISAAESLQELEGKLTGAIGGMVTWFVGQDQNLGTFGDSVGKFADGFQKLANCEGVNATTIETIISAAESLQELEGKLDGSVGGVVSWWKGQDQNLGTFGESIQKFGDGMKSLKECEGLNDTLVTTIVSAAGSLRGITDSLDENAGGLFDWFIGNEKLKQFGEAIKPFGEGMSALKQCEGLNTETIESVTSAATMLNGVKTALDENAGGLFDWFIGNEKLKSFGEAIEPFATSMAKLADCKALDQATIESLKTAAVSLGGLQTTLSEGVDGLMDYFVSNLSEDKLGTFGTNIGLFADGMGKLNTALGENGFSEEAISSMKTVAEEINTLQKNLPSENIFDTKMDLEEFSEYMTNFATAVSSVGSTASGLDSEAIDLLIRTGYRIKSFIIGLADFSDDGISKFAGGGLKDGAAVNLAQAIHKFSKEAEDINADHISSIITSTERIRDLITSLADLNTDGVNTFDPNAIAIKIKTYCDTIADISINVISNSITCAGYLRDLIGSLNGISISGVQPFGVALPKISYALKNYNTDVTGFNLDNVKASVSAGKELRDFIKSLSGITSGSATTFKQAVEELSTVDVAGVVDAFSAATDDMKKVGLDMFNALLNGMGSNMTGLKRTVMTMLDSMNNVALSWNSKFVQTGNDIVSKLSNGITDSTSKATTAMSSCLSSAVTTIRDSYQQFYNAGSYLVTGFKNGISENAYKAVDAAESMAKAAIAAAKEALHINSPSKDFIKIGLGTGEGMAVGIEESSVMVDDAVEVMASSAIDTAEEAGINSGESYTNGFETGVEDSSILDRVTNYLSDNGISSIVKSYGHTLGESYSTSFSDGSESGLKKFWNSITGKTDDAVAATTSELEHYQDLVKRVLNGEFGNRANRKNALTKAGENYAAVQALINKVWERNGGSFSDATITLEELNEVLGSVSTTTAAMTNSMSDSLEYVSSLADTDMNMEMTITPVLDLDEAETGMALLNNMYGNSSISIGTKWSANDLNALNNRINQNSQNDSNDDVVDAINDLGDDMKNVKGDTYIIEGITYNDGSAESNALKTIIRAVQMGGRV